MPSIISPTRWWRTLKREWLIYHLGLPEFRFMFDKPPPNEWVSLDCETTGLNVGTDEIISIGAVRIVGNKIMTSERFEVLVRPERGVSPDSVRIHRLRGQDVAQGLPTAVTVHVTGGTDQPAGTGFAPEPGRLRAHLEG